MPTPPRRRALLQILLVLVPLLLVQMFWGLLPLPWADPARVVNGMLVLPATGVDALVMVAAWAWAVTAGIAAMAGVDRPLLRALRALPTVGAALLAAVMALLAAVLLLGLVLPAVEEGIWVVIALLALPVGAFLVRLALVLPVGLLEGRRGRLAFRTASADVRGRAVGLGILLLVGFMAPALLHSWAFARPEEHVSSHLQGALVWLLRDASLVVVTALQAATLLAAYRRLPGRLLRPLAIPGAGPAEAVPNRLSRRLRRLTASLGLAAVLLPSLLAGGVVAADRLPEVTVHTPALPHRMIAVGWPAGRGPILVGQQSIEDCLDDGCRTRRRTELSVTMYEPYGGVAFGADGAVFALGQYQLEQCDAQRVCRRRPGDLPGMRNSGAAAIALAPSGDILIATATEIRPAKGAGEAGQVELKLLRCTDVFCATPRITSLGTAPGSLKEQVNSWRRRWIAVGTDVAGRPVVVFRSPSRGTVSVGWCVTPDCAAGDLAELGDPRRPGMPTVEELALLDFDDMFDCARLPDCTGDEPIVVVHPPHGGLYGLTVAPGRPAGFHVRIGSPAPPARRLTLRVCADTGCHGPRLIPLVELVTLYSNVPGRQSNEYWLMAVDPGGRMVATDLYGNQLVITEL
ncbi:hypothetical protein ABZ570_13200 [Micromonospora sp. NPDC007271]|uniref:hypothetical protein n=1 Tax=Micromonospora sp. NPDC007271 TaxID=3154587 RepID=UPI0033D99DAB